jgi:hypothetical protein
VIIDAILNRAPVAPLALNPDLPGQLEQILDKALEKDRHLRYQSAADFRTDLQRLVRDLSSEEAVPHRTRPSASSAVTDSASPNNHRLTHYTLGAAVSLAAVVVIAVMAAVVWRHTRTRSETFRTFAVSQVTNTGIASLAAISPDGKSFRTTMASRACGSGMSLPGVTSRSFRRQRSLTAA